MAPRPLHGFYKQQAHNKLGQYAGNNKLNIQEGMIPFFVINGKPRKIFDVPANKQNTGEY